MFEADKNRPLAASLWSLFLLLVLAWCGRGQSTSLAGFLSDVASPLGWTPSGEVRLFNQENLYDLVDGQAESFFTYGFEQVAVQDYENEDGAVLGVEIWRLDTPADAYGLFTASIAGAPVDVGNDGDGDLGRRLAFWQDRYYVRVRARQELEDAELRRFADAVSGSLPSGGERPGLLDQLPRDGLVERSAVFFHEEISIQDRLWLGGENLLGLGAETDGVLAQYDVDGAVARLLLVQYPDAEAASAGQAALKDSQVGRLVASDVRDDLLGAVLGEVDRATADALLAQALGN